MAKLTLGYGLFLIVWGAVFSMDSDSVTSWIPAMMGAPIAFAGLMSIWKPESKKAWMHVAVLFGLLAFLGGFRFFAGMGSEDGLFGNVKAASSQLMLLVTGGIYTALCVRSFIAARRGEGQEA